MDLRRTAVYAVLVSMSSVPASSASAGEKEAILREAVSALNSTPLLVFDEEITRGADRITARCQMAAGRLKTEASLNGKWRFALLLSDGMIDEYHAEWLIDLVGFCKGLERFPNSAENFAMSFQWESGDNAARKELVRGQDEPLANFTARAKALLSESNQKTLFRIHLRYPAQSPAGIESLMLPSSADCMTGSLIYTWVGGMAEDNFVESLLRRQLPRCRSAGETIIADRACAVIEKEQTGSGGWSRIDRYAFDQVTHLPAQWTTVQTQGESSVRQEREFRYKVINGSPEEVSWSFEFPVTESAIASVR